MEDYLPVYEPHLAFLHIIDHKRSINGALLLFLAAQFLSNPLSQRLERTLPGKREQKEDKPLVAVLLILVKTHDLSNLICQILP